jgi:hypothetical protein
MPANKAIVLRLVEVACDAIIKEVETLNASGEDVVSAYTTMCRNALLAARKHGVYAAPLLDVLQRMLLEVSEPKGRVS